MNTCHWIATDVKDRRALPPALRVRGEKCFTPHREGFVCTRSQGHTGRHAASGGRHVLAVWA